MDIPLKQFPDGCGGCGGACCKEKNFGLPPWSEDERYGLIARLKEVIGLSRAIQHSIEVWNVPKARDIEDPRDYQGDCVFLADDGSCQIHSVKPAICADMPFRGEECEAARREHGVLPHS